MSEHDRLCAKIEELCGFRDGAEYLLEIASDFLRRTGDPINIHFSRQIHEFLDRAGGSSKGSTE